MSEVVNQQYLMKKRHQLLCKIVPKSLCENWPNRKTWYFNCMQFIRNSISSHIKWKHFKSYWPQSWFIDNQWKWIYYIEKGPQFIVDNFDFFHSNETFFHSPLYVHAQNSYLWFANLHAAVHEIPLHNQKTELWIAISRRISSQKQ